MAEPDYVLDGRVWGAVGCSRAARGARLALFVGVRATVWHC